LQCIARRAPIELFHDVGFFCSIAQPRVVRQYLSPRFSHRVESAVADNTCQPGTGVAAFGRKARRILPDLDKGVLQHVGRKFRTPHDPLRNPMQSPRLQLIKPLQRASAAALHRLDERAGRGKVANGTHRLEMPESAQLVQGPRLRRQLRSRNNYTQIAGRWMQAGCRPRTSICEMVRSSAHTVVTPARTSTTGAGP
jgi:hypothetical protein